jgi:lauroyl/myristoyl acyltransferase
MKKCVANILDRDFNDPQVRSTARRCMRNFCKYIVDLLRYPAPTKEFFNNQFAFQGKDNLDAALKEGKGVILVSFHMGNLDLGIRCLSSLGYRVNAIVDNLEWSQQLDAFLQKPRARSGAKLINPKETSSRVLENLRRNEILALMIDCPTCNRGVLVKLGRKWVRMPSGAATLALRTGARLIPCGLVRTSNLTFKAIFGKPIEYIPGGKLAEDTRQMTQLVINALEDLTRSFVDQWYIFHPLIKDELQEIGRSSGPGKAFYPVH